MTDHRWQEEQAIHFGTDNQRERYQAGLLPEDELLSLARLQLFAPFAPLRRWSNGRSLRPGSARHAPGCPAALAGGRYLERSVIFETAEATEMSEAEHAQLQVVRDLATAASAHPWCTAAGVAFEVDPRAHWATCTACGHETTKHTAVVSIRWAGRTLTREYDLTA